jgi:aerobic-type carbon monoxide dehydrogenase small subunit (CoxS/CutS family)
MATKLAMSVQLTVNGEKRGVTTDPDRPLLDVLREDFGLTGTKYGCGQAQCGACSVLVDGERVFSCRTPVRRAEGKTVLTIEGLAQGDALHPVQQAFLDEGAFQCGYCTAGMIMNTVALLNANPHPTDEQIIEEMDRNLCRCCIYPKIIRAIRCVADRKGG